MMIGTLYSIPDSLVGNLLSDETTVLLVVAESERPGIILVSPGCLSENNENENRYIAGPERFKNGLKSVFAFDLSTRVPIEAKSLGEPLAKLSADGVEEMLRSQIGKDVARFFNAIHRPRLNATFRRGETFIPSSGKVFGESEMKALVDSSLDFWLTADRWSEAFKERLTGILGCRNVIPTNSGSSANLLAIAALTSPSLKERRLMPGDEVITTAVCFSTTISPIIQHGLQPVFVDIDLDTMNAFTERLETAISKRTKAIFLAHTLGNPFDLDAVLDLAKRHNLWVIEDSCDALGATWNGKNIGTLGDIGTFSFYPAHMITMGEGGALVTSDPHLARLIRSFRDWGRDCWCDPGRDDTCHKRFNMQLGDLPYGYDHKYTFSHFGYNLKITDMQAAVGYEQLTRLESFIEKRRANYGLLRSRLRNYETVFRPVKALEKAVPAWFGYPITLEGKLSGLRNELVGFLENRKIATRLIFGGNILRQPCFDEMRKSKTGYRVAGDLANSNKVTEDSLWLGLYPGLGQEEIEYIADNLIEFAEKKLNGK
jgi:CDP-4-dehydro-6-deoxyglucose reductase, E1